MKPKHAIQFLERISREVDVVLNVDNMSDEDIVALMSSIADVGFAAMLSNTGGNKEIRVAEKYNESGDP